MSTPEKKDIVRDFLEDVKRTMTRNDVPYDTWVMVPRAKNLLCLTQLGMTLNDVYTIVLSLSVNNYSEGPTTDPMEKGECWVFGTIVDKSEIYIKLKLATISVIKKVRIISFHVAERILIYPWQQKEESNGDQGGKV